MPENTSTFEDITLNDRTEVQSILGSPPGWMTNWGITAVLGVVFLLLAISWIIKYPETIEARVVLLTENPPVKIMAKNSGRIQELLVEDKEFVRSNTVLAVLENTANRNEINQLKSLLQAYQIQGESSLNNLPKLSKLGELQNQYTLLQQSMEDYSFYINQADASKKIGQLQIQVENIKRLNQSLKEQQVIFQKELGYARKIYDRNQQLKADVISQQDFEKESINFLQKERQYKSLETQIINNDIQLGQLNGQILELSQLTTNTQQNKRASIRQAVEKLEAAIKDWNYRYLLIAPIDGKVSMTKIWSNNQFVTLNREVFTILPPEGSGEIMGRAALPIQGSGKVKIAQQVQIYLDEFPAQEFGSIEATVHDIALIPQDEQYQIEIKLINGLETNANRSLVFKQQMPGSAKIILEEKRVIEHFLHSVLSVLRENT